MQWYNNDRGSRLCLLYILRTRFGGERRGLKKVNFRGHLSHFCLWWTYPTCVLEQSEQNVRCSNQLTHNF